MSRLLRTLAPVFCVLAWLVPGPGARAASPEAEAARAEIEAAFGFVPTVFTVLPEDAQAPAWEALRDLEFNPNTVLPDKIKSLIGIAVAAQIPCHYCLYLDTGGARLNGATDVEIAEALGMAANTRMWSTMLNGMMTDHAGFTRDLDAILAFVAQGKPGPAPAAVTDAASAYQDMEANLGLVPGFLRSYPQAGIAGAWKAFKSVQMNPNTQLNGKYKELIGLAVAAQIPCTYCVEAHVAFAKAHGSTQEEIAEAVAMAALTRHWSTVVNGSQQDLEAFKSEADRMLQFAGRNARADKE